MNVLFDTSFLVAVERKNADAVALAKRLTERDVFMGISMVTVSEIVTGAHLREDYKKALASARTVLGQFNWIEVDARIAFKTGEIMAFLQGKGMPIEYQDCVIAATAIDLDADLLVTENKQHFERVPSLEDRTVTLDEALRKTKKR